MRFLPSTVVIIVVGADRRAPDRPHRPAAADDRRPADRRPARCSGRATSRSTRATASCVGAFVLMGLGMGLVMSPMSTAGDERRRPARRPASPRGMLSMSRMVGGTFGVAVMGALITGLGRPRLDDLLPALPAARAPAARRRARRRRRARAGGRRGRRRAARRSSTRSTRPAHRRRRRASLGAVLAWLLIADRAERAGRGRSAEDAERRAAPRPRRRRWPPAPEPPRRPGAAASLGVTAGSAGPRHVDATQIRALRARERVLLARPRLPAATRTLDALGELLGLHPLAIEDTQGVRPAAQARRLRRLACCSSFYGAHRQTGRRPVEVHFHVSRPRDRHGPPRARATQLRRGCASASAHDDDPTPRRSSSTASSTG